MKRLDNKTAIITGGTSGIGRCTVLNFVEQGAKVLFTGRDQKRADETLKLVAGLGGEAQFVQHDISDEQDWAKVMNAAQEYLGPVDICVNCAGVFAYGPIEETSIENFKDMWKINVDGAFLGIKSAMAAMENNPNGGSIGGAKYSS
jgi:NAD(P)-dependent dehydrogenase (short-subunit alcohol dehydrogenase family)